MIRRMMVADLKTGLLTAFGKEIAISCDVRNEINGQRSLTEPVVRSMPSKKAIMPRTFPSGIWNVQRPLMRTDPYLAPYFIPSTAMQELPIWTEVDGHYGQKSGALTADYGYGLHYSTSRTTQGCIKIKKKEDLLFLVDKINQALDSGETVSIEVKK
jgi:hypothetical protein